MLKKTQNFIYKNIICFPITFDITILQSTQYFGYGDYHDHVGLTE